LSQLAQPDWNLLAFGRVEKLVDSTRAQSGRANYNPAQETLLIHWSLGSILITGPKAEAFFEQFSEHKIALLKADGKDILRVTMSLRQGNEQEEA